MEPIFMLRRDRSPVIYPRARIPYPRARIPAWGSLSTQDGDVLPPTLVSKCRPRDLVPRGIEKDRSSASNDSV